jgi:hypothetical protein
VALVEAFSFSKKFSEYKLVIAGGIDGWQRRYLELLADTDTRESDLYRQSI